MERIYRLTYGPYYEEQELGYLTEDKLNDYLEELFNSALIQSSIRSHIETLKVQKMAYETQRHHIVQDMNKCLPILQDGKTNPKYKETKKLGYKNKDILNKISFKFNTNVQIKSTELSIKSVRKENSYE